MRLLKILFVFFLIYFIRRFIQMYKAVKALQEAQMKAQDGQVRRGPTATPVKAENVINADFKVVD